MFGHYNIETMNETDVREIIVRPLLGKLGYQQGTEANIRTETSFRYGQAFLGRKNPASDPAFKDLRGRADYICDVISYGRWVVEVKSPTETLTIDDAQQAHTYAAHPEVAALFYLVTNGRMFRLYRVSYPDTPLFEWRTEETESFFLALFNILSPDAIKKVVHVPVDFGKPLGKGFASKLQIIGGTITYGRHTSSNPMFKEGVKQMEGASAGIVGVGVERDDAGQIVGTLQVAGPYSFWDEVNKAAGIEVQRFKTSDEYVSVDQSAPTIFQNFEKAVVPKGAAVQFLPGQPKFPLPFRMAMDVYTEAAGFLHGTEFRGTFGIVYEITLGPEAAMLGSPTFSLTGEGVFAVRVN
jgi:hypothetical protein